MISHESVQFHMNLYIISYEFATLYEFKQTLYKIIQNHHLVYVFSRSSWTYFHSPEQRKGTKLKETEVFIFNVFAIFTDMDNREKTRHYMAKKR